MFTFRTTSIVFFSLCINCKWISIVDLKITVIWLCIIWYSYYVCILCDSCFLTAGWLKQNPMISKHFSFSTFPLSHTHTHFLSLFIYFSFLFLFLLILNTLLLLILDTLEQNPIILTHFSIKTPQTHTSSLCPPTFSSLSFIFSSWIPQQKNFSNQSINHFGYTLLVIFQIN